MTMTQAAFEAAAQAAADAASLILQVSVRQVAVTTGGPEEEIVARIAAAFPADPEAPPPMPSGTVVSRLDGAGDVEITPEDLATHLAAAVAAVTGE